MMTIKKIKSHRNEDRKKLMVEMEKINKTLGKYS